MISVIVCSIQDPGWTVHEHNVAKTVGEPHEYLRIDNRGTSTGICSAYNRGVEQAKGDILVFMHEDVFFMEPGWGQVLTKKFADPTIGLVGVAGTQYLSNYHRSWSMAGQPFIRGRVIHDLNDGRDFSLTVFNWDKSDADVVAVDGLFFAIRRELFSRIRFDEQTFDKYHFYDLDISMQVRRTHRIVVTWDILLKHCSAGKPDDVWQEQGTRFLAKYREELPANCAGIDPDLTKPGKRGMDFDIRGKVPQEIIC